MDAREKKVFVILAFALLFGGSAIILTVAGVLTPKPPQDYNPANQLNTCTPPAGVTQSEWQQHMSHHPDQYTQCLNK